MLGVEDGRPVRERLILKGKEPRPQTENGLVFSSLPPLLPLSLSSRALLADKTMTFNPHWSGAAGAPEQWK